MSRMIERIEQVLSAVFYAVFYIWVLQALVTGVFSFWVGASVLLFGHERFGLKPDRIEMVVPWCLLLMICGTIMTFLSWDFYRRRKDAWMVKP